MPLDLEHQLVTNLKFFLDLQFLNNGLYFNVASGQLDFEGNAQGRLFRVTNDPDFLEGRVYQSQYKNWVYETDTVAPSGSPSPIIASGVFVNGAFKTRADLVYGHAIDYPGGRVIFNSTSAVLATDTVEAAFCVRRVQTEELNERIFPLVHDLLVGNPEIQSPHALPSGLALPAVLIDRVASSSRGLQLGGGKITERDVDFHILSRDPDIIKPISFIMTELEETALKMVDWGVAPQPLTEIGDTSSAYVPFSTLQDSTQISFRAAYFRKMEARRFGNKTGLQIEIVSSDIEMWRKNA